MAYTLDDAKYSLGYYYEYPTGNKKSKTISDINMAEDDTATVNSPAGMTVDMAYALATKITTSVQGSTVVYGDSYPRKIIEERRIVQQGG